MVEDLRADRVLALALLALVDDGAHETGGKDRERGEPGRELHREALPRPERRRRQRARARPGHAAVSDWSTRAARGRAVGRGTTGPPPPAGGRSRSRPTGGVP